MSALHLLLFAGARAGTIELTSGPEQGTELSGDEYWYDDAEASVSVSGEVSGLSAVGTYIAIANGVSTEVDCGGVLPAGIVASWSHAGTDGGFVISTPIGTDAPAWYRPHVQATCGAMFATSAWPDDTPHQWWLQDEDRVLRPVTIEVFESPTYDRVARERYLVYDVRAKALETRETNDVAIHGMWAQLAPSGLDALAATWTSLLPQPSLEAVQAAIDANVPLVGEVEDESFDRACFDLDDASAFVALSEYSAGLATMDPLDAVSAFLTGDTLGFGAYEQALLIYGAYQVARQAATATALIPVVNLAAGALAQSLCVKSLPSASDFEVCVGGVSQELTDLSLGGVESSELAFTATSGGLEADTVLADVDADVTTHLSDVRIRWKNRATCTIAPGADVDLDDTADPERAWLDEWSTCTDLDFDVGTLSRVAADGAAVTLPLELADDAGALFAEAAEGSLFSAAGVSWDVGAQTCAEAWIVDDVEALLPTWEVVVETEVARAWDAGLPDNAESLAVAPLLEPFDYSLEEPEHHTLTATLDHLETSRLGGLELGWTTNTEVRAESGYGIERRWWVHAEAAPRSWWATGKDPSGASYDLAVSLTTGHLNQVLRSLANSALLYQVPIEPTYGEVGHFDSSVSADETAVLTPTVLASLDPSLAAITPSTRGQVVYLYASRKMAPFVHMGGDDLRLEVGRLAVELREDDDVGNPVGLWLEFEADLWDPDLELDLDPDHDTLAASFGGEASWTYTVTTNNVPGCEGGAVAAAVPSCEDLLLEQLAYLVEPHLDAMVLGLFRHVPMPLTWDGGGQAPVVTRARQVNRFMSDEVITWTAQLENGQSR